MQASEVMAGCEARDEVGLILIGGVMSDLHAPAAAGTERALATSFGT